MDEELRNYITDLVSPDNKQSREIAKDYQFREDVQPYIEPESAKLMGILIKMLTAKKILELGTCIGYSAVWLGEAAKSSGGKVITIEKEEQLCRDAREHLEKAGLKEYVQVKHGDANEEIEKFHSESFDLIFQDGKKALYPQMLDRTVDLVRVGGVIVADDTLMKVTEAPQKSVGASMDEYNRSVFADERLYSTILPVGDGVTISYKMRS